MVRTLISLTEEDKQWLDREATRLGVSMTELVRRAVRLYRDSARQEPFDVLLSRTAGSLDLEPGLSLQRRLRDEWEGR
jgi:Ribbon-helix-helix protein, copG family